MPEEKQYYILAPGEKQGRIVDAQLFEQNKDEFMGRWPDAQVREVSNYNKDDNDITSFDSFEIYSADGVKQSSVNADVFRKNRDEFYQNFPDAQVRKIRNVSAQHDLEFAYDYQETMAKANDKSLSDDERRQYSIYVEDFADRYNKILDRYGMTAPGPEKGLGFLGGAWQSVKKLGGGLLNSLAEGGRSIRKATLGPMADDLLWADALNEMNRRAAAGEPVFRNDEAPDSITRSQMSREERKSVDRKQQIDWLLNKLKKEAEGRGENPEDSVRGMLAQSVDTSDTKVMQDAANKIIEENSKPLSGWGKVGALLPMGVASAGAVALAATGHPTAAKAVGDVTMGTFAASSHGEAYKAARDAGATDEQAGAAALASAGIMYLMGRIPVNKYISDVTSSVAARTVAKAGGEALEKELQQLAADAAARGIVIEGAEKALAGEFFKSWGRNIASHTASFAAMGAMEALVPLIYEDPEKYDALHNVLEATKSGALDGFLMGAFVGGFSSGVELHNRVKQWQSYAAQHPDLDGIYIAEVEFTPDNVVGYYDRASKSWQEVDTSNQPKAGPQFAEIIGGDPSKPNTPLAVQLSDGSIVSVTPDAVRVARKVGFKRAVEDAEKAYAEQGYDAGRKAITDGTGPDIAVETEYQKAKAEAERQEGIVSDATRLDEARANAAVQGRKDSIREIIEQRLGRPFDDIVRRGNADDGGQLQEYVSVITYPDGSRVYVTAVDPQTGDLAGFNDDGANILVNRENLENGLADGTITSYEGRVALDTFLEQLVAEQDAIDEQERMAQELAQNIVNLADRVGKETHINIGTPESETLAAILEVNPFPTEDGGGVVVNTENGPQVIGWEEIARKFGMPYEPKTNAQLVQERLAADTQGLMDSGTVPPSDGSTPTASPSQTEVQQEAPTPIQYNDEAANQLGLDAKYAVDVDGSIEVNTKALWEDNPALWAQYNDLNPDKSMSSMDYLAKRIEQLDGEIAKQQSLRQKEELGAMDQDKIRGYKKKIAEISQRRQQVDDVYQQYVAADKAAKEAEAAAREAEFQAKLAEKKALREQKASELQQSISDDENFKRIQKRLEDAKKAQGSADMLVFGGQEFGGHYYLVEADTPTASHQATKGWTPVPGFPRDETGRSLNTRDYEHEKESQQHVMNTASDYDSRALQHMVVMTSDGIVISGNERTMASQLAAQNNTDAKYVDYLKKYPHKFGFTPEQVAEFEHPRVVFVPDGALQYTAKLFDLFNQSEEKRQGVVATAAKVAKITDDNLVMQIANLLQGVDDIDKVYNDIKMSNQLLHVLEDAKVITREDRPMYQSGEGLTKAGEEFVESVLFGSIFSTSDQAVRDAMADKSIRRAVAYAFPVLVRVKNLPEQYSIINEMTDAVSLLVRAKKANGGKVDGALAHYMNQFNLFSEGLLEEKGTTQLLANALSDKRYSKLRIILNQFVQRLEDGASGQTDFWSGGVVETKAQILKEVLEFNHIDTTVYGNVRGEVSQNDEIRLASGSGGGVGNGVNGRREANTPGVPGEGNTGIQEGAAPAAGRADGEIAAAIAAARHEVNTNPTEAQKEAGNYKKGHLKIDGYDITIENPKGSLRSGVNADGKAWETLMNNDYGYLRGTEGVDGDHIDVFLSDAPERGSVFVIDQVDPMTGKFDEHKVMYGFPDAETARAAYLSNYEDGWQGLGAITEVNKDEFKRWIDSSHRKIKPFSAYSSVKPVGDVRVERPIEGLENYSRKEISNLVENYISGRLSEVSPEEFSLKSVTPIGSRTNGTALPGSDLDVLVEYEGTMREDDAFNMLHGDNPLGEGVLEIEGIKVDINPIRPQESGTAKGWLKKNESFRKREAHIKAQDAAFSLIRTNINEVLSEKLQRQLDDIDGMIRTASSRQERESFMRDRADAIQKELKSDAHYPVHVVTRENLADTMIANGVPRGVVEYVEQEISGPDRARGFRYRDRSVYVIADDIIDAKDARSTLRHEEWHNITDEEGYDNLLLGLEGVTRGELLAGVDYWSGNDVAYHGLTLKGLANEFISMAMDNAEGQPAEAVAQMLSEAGVTNPNIVNFVETHKNERRLREYYADTRGGRRGTSLSRVNTPGVVSQNVGDSETLPDRNLGQKDGGFEKIGARGAGSGEGQEAGFSRVSDEPVQKEGESDFEFFERSNGYINKHYPAVAKNHLFYEWHEGRPRGESSPDGETIRLYVKPGTPYSDIEAINFHENLHCYLRKTGDNTSAIRGFVSAQLAKYPAANKALLDKIKSLKNVDGSPQYPTEALQNEELYVQHVHYAMSRGAVPKLLQEAPEDIREITENYLKTRKYEIQAETDARRRLRHGGDDSVNGRQSGEKREGRLPMRVAELDGDASRYPERLRKLSAKEQQRLRDIDRNGRFNPEITSEIGPETSEGTVLFSRDKGDRTLVGLHNISEEKLAKAFQIGGLANPSAAVIDISHQDHFGYGQISLVMPSSLVDMKTGRNAGTWDRDAWTPMYPNIEYFEGKETKARLKELVKGVEDPDLNDRIRSRVGAYMDGDTYNSALEYVFLQQKGLAPEIQTVPSKYPFLTTEILQQALGMDTFEDGSAGYEAYLSLPAEKKRAFNLLEKTGNDPNSRRAIKAEQNEAYKKFFDNLLNEDLSFAEFNILMYGVARDKNYAGNPDPSRTIDKAIDIVREQGLQKEFSDWQTKAIEGLGYIPKIFLGYTPRGDRRYKEATLENVSAYMKKQGRNASADHSQSGAGILRARLAQKFTGLAQMRAAKDRLTADYDDPRIKEINDRIRDAVFTFYSDEVSRVNGMYTAELVAQGYAEDIVVRGMSVDDVIEKFRQKEHIVLNLSDEEKESLAQLRKDIKNMPTFYFETKFERPVYLQEFVAAVVPSETSAAIKDQLRQNGLKLYEYDKDSEGSRREATLKATASDDVRFSFIGQIGAERLDMAEGLPGRVSNLEVARKMEKDGKDALAIKMSTGWERGADNKWRYEIMPFKAVDPAGNIDYDKRHPEYVRYKQLVKQSNGSVFMPEQIAPLSAEERAELDRLALDYGPGTKLHQSSRLKDYVDYDELFAAYPEMRNMPVRFVDFTKKSLPGEAYYDYDKKEIVVDEARRYSSKFGDHLAHEIQHAIQDAEGFSEGTSLEEAARKATSMSKDPLTDYQKQFVHDYELWASMDERTKEGYPLADFLNSIRGTYDEDFFNDTIAGRSLEELRGEFNRLKMMQSRAKIVNPWDVYRRTSGEVEARNVVARMGLDEEGIRTILAAQTEDVARKDQVLNMPTRHLLDIDGVDNRDFSSDDNTGAHVGFSVVEDPKRLEALEKSITIPVYRAMALIDGKLYPPMSMKEPNAKGQKGKLKFRNASQLGVWEQSDEAPDKAYQGENGKWYFDLKKQSVGEKLSDTNGVLYNPYFHTSASPLNDQFTGAWRRPELVTVETEIPISELTSGYKAEKANDAVGAKDWHSGTVTGQLGEGRQVVLSRWAKPVRIVPDREVASIIAPKLKAKGISVPYNVVTPSLRAELEKQGVNIIDESAGLKQLKELPVQFSRVYHGSRKDFDRFDHSHMGEGEGAQAHGWGTYVAFDKRVAKGYASRLGAEEKERAEELQRQYNELENDWQNSVRLDKEDARKLRDAAEAEGVTDAQKASLLNTAEQIEAYGSPLTQQYDRAAGLVRARMAISSYSIRPREDVKQSNAWVLADATQLVNNAGGLEKAKEFYRKSVDYMRQNNPNAAFVKAYDYIAGTEEADWINNRNLYQVEIPDDNGRNYLHEQGALGEEDLRYIYDVLEDRKETDVLVDLNMDKLGLDKYEEFKELVDPGTGEYVYWTLGRIIGGPREASRFLNELGYAGMRYTGYTDGDCAVIFNESDLEITGHVRFSRVYHGSGANFDSFNLEHALEGEGNMSHGYGHYVALDKNTARGYAWNIAFEVADRNGLIEPGTQEIVGNDSLGSFEEMVARYNEVLKARQQEYKANLDDAIREGDDPKDIEQYRREYDTISKYRPLDEVLKDGRNLYEIEIPDDTGDNYIDEMKTLPKAGRRRIADVVRGMDDSLLRRDSHGPNWLPNGLETLANTIEREQYAGLELRRRLTDAFGSEKEASKIMRQAGFVGIKYDGRVDGPCAVIFDEEDMKITDKIRFSRIGNNINFVNDETEESERNQIANRRDGRGIPGNGSGRVSISGDRSRIRVLEPELAAVRRNYTADSEGNYQRREDREKESQRLIEAAKANGLYVEPKRLGEFGVHIPGNTFESEIYADIDNGRYIKVKDPFASEPMTQNAPADAIYQHIIHNIFFPEARYEFLGVSEKNGDVRILLAQEFVPAFKGATPEEAAKYLKKRGYSTADGYTFENEEVVVTDLEEENLLIDNNGNYHPIDPIIKYKVPAWEIIDNHIQANEGIKFSRVYHGTAADFDKFDHSHMGEGEGNQSFGWGTYVTEDKGIGKYYADVAFRSQRSRRIIRFDPDFDYYWKGQLIDQDTVNPLQLARDVLDDQGTIAKARAKAERFLEMTREGNPEMAAKWEEAVKVLSESTKADFTRKKADRTDGRLLYEVEIPDEDTTMKDDALWKKYLNWFSEGKMKGENAGSLLLGKPSAKLLACGLPSDTTMFIQPKVLRENLNKHGLTVDDIMELPAALRNPLFVYEWGTKAKSLVVVTEIDTKDGNKITAAIKLERNGRLAEVNELAGIHRKDAGRMLSELIDEGINKVHGGIEKAIKYIQDKEKVLDWLGIAPPKGAASLTEQELSVANVINSFKNPTVEEKKYGTYLPWRENVSDEVHNIIYNALKKLAKDKKNKDLAERVKVKQPTVEQLLGENGEARTGEEVYNGLSLILGSPVEASKFLHEAGFTGIKYSADAGHSQKNNFVIFDENDLSIENKIKFSRLGEPVQGSLFTEDGESVQFESLGGLPDGPVVHSYVERQFEKNKVFSFTGAERIESAADVAYIFKALETQGVENSFLVFIKNGKPTILHMCIGTYNNVNVDYYAMIVGFREFAPDEIYLVHNHPSGDVRPSRADLEETRKLQRMAGDTPLSSIIIDTLSGEYMHFTDDFDFDRKTRPGSIGEEVPIEVQSFSKMVFGKDYRQDGLKVRGPEDVAAYLSAHRLGNGSKVFALLCGNGNSVNGNIVFPANEITNDNARALAREAAAAAARTNSSMVILSGDFAYDEGVARRFRSALEIVSGGSVRLGDVVKVEGNHTLSADAGTLRDSHGDEDRPVPRRAAIAKVEEDGLPGLLGEEDASDLLRNAYRTLPEEVRGQINDAALGSDLDFKKAFRNYLARLAEDGYQQDETGLLRALAEEIRALSGNPALTDNDLRYMIWRDAAGATNGDLLALAKQVALKRRFGVGEDDVRFSMAKDFADITEEGREKVSDTVDEAAAGLKATRKAEEESAANDDLKAIARAMRGQRNYDRATLSSIIKYAKEILKGGRVDALTRTEATRLLTLVGKTDGKAPVYVKRYADQLTELLLDHIVKGEKERLMNLVNIKDTRIAPTGVEVRGALEVLGQTTLKAMRDYMKRSAADIDERLMDISDDLSNDSDPVRKKAWAERAGLLLAKEYQQSIVESENEEADLKREIADFSTSEVKNKIGAEAAKEYAESSREALRENRIDRVDSYRRLAKALSEEINRSAKAGKEFRDADDRRIEAIHYDANRDMQGVPTDIHRRETRLDRTLNHDAMRFLFKPLATFDQMLRLFGRMNIGGEGYLWNRFMRGWVDASEKAYEGLKSATDELDAKVSEVYGKKMTWNDLYKEERKMSTATVSFMDGGEMKKHEITPGQLLYIYMVNKMSDGRMKLRKMGIDEDDVRKIAANLDSRFIQLADWLQGEFLVKLRNKYNAVHESLFDAPMAAIDDYFPIKINAGDRVEEVDLSNSAGDNPLSSTVTGSIIKRRRNSKALDIMHADAFSVVIEHLQQMEDWAAWAPYRKDLNTLLSYKHFRNQVQNMKTIYGSDKTLWRNFAETAAIAAGSYRPKVGRGDLDTIFLNVAKGVTAAKISFRLNTALKQILSAPAYLTDANLSELGKALAHPKASWNWCLENLPLFRKRLESRIAGDTRLMDTDSDWKIWHRNVVQEAGRLGMAPNAFVDALTISVGAKAMYETKLRKYLALGIDRVTAERRAKQDATILYNETQQSSEGAFTSSMQLERTVISTTLTTYRNSSMSYQRQLHHAIRSYSRMAEKSYRDRSIAFMTNQYKNEGATDEGARKGAEQDYERAKTNNAARIAVFAFLLPFLWNIGIPYYLILGKDKKKKKEMLTDAAIKTLAGPLEGLSGGNIISDAWGTLSSGGSLGHHSLGQLPIRSDIERVINILEHDQPAVINEIANIVVQSGFGVNPQTLTDTVVAIIDACNGDLGVAKEAAILLMRIAQVPQSQIEQIYIDEIQMSAKDASKASPKELAERYARYKVMRDAPLTGWAYSDEERKKKEKNKVKSLNKKINERKELDKND